MFSSRQLSWVRGPTTTFTAFSAVSDHQHCGNGGQQDGNDRVSDLNLVAEDASIQAHSTLT